MGESMIQFELFNLFVLYDKLFLEYKKKMFVMFKIMLHSKYFFCTPYTSIISST